MHECYFCGHRGDDVNRIATYKGIRSTDYCCDDATECDAGWQKGKKEDKIKRAVKGELFMSTVLGTQAINRVATRIVARVMELEG